MKYPEPPPLSPQPRAPRVSHLTPREQRMLDQARRWRAKGPGAREQRRRELRWLHVLWSHRKLAPLNAWIVTPESESHWITNP